MEKQNANSLRPGDTVYFPIALDGEPSVEKIKVVEVGERYVFFPEFSGGESPDMYFYTGDLGVMFFLTEGEALKAARDQINLKEK